MMGLRTRDAMAAAVFLAASAGAWVDGLNILQIHSQNRVIAGYAAGQDNSLPRDTGPVLRAARGVFLLKQNRVDDAQAELDSMPAELAAGPRNILLYAMANAHLRRALEIFDSAPMRKVAPLIGLAQSEYRQVLRADPQNWDARYNFDIASSLTHDPEVAAYLKGDDMARERALVPDAPGAPNGLP